MKKNKWTLFLFVLAGIVLGSFIASTTQDINALKWMNYGLNFGLGSPTSSNNIVLDLSVIVISFAFKIKISIGSIIGILLSIFIYKKL